jgi:hypothetical protein
VPAQAVGEVLASSSFSRMRTLSTCSPVIPAMLGMLKAVIIDAAGL